MPKKKKIKIKKWKWSPVCTCKNLFCNYFEFYFPKNGEESKIISLKNMMLYLQLEKILNENWLHTTRKILTEKWRRIKDFFSNLYGTDRVLSSNVYYNEPAIQHWPISFDSLALFARVPLVQRIFFYAPFY